MSTTLRAATLALRPLRDGDVEDLVAILARPGVREWWSPLDDAEHTTDGLHNDSAAFAIEVGGAVAGWLGYSEEADPDSRHANLDIFLAPEYQGRRLGRMALLLAADWLFDQRGHHRLTVDPACSNARAIRAYEAVGFRPVGTMRRYERGADGRWHDNLLMDLLPEELRRNDRSGGSVAVVSDLAIRSAAEQDIEQVLLLWEAAGSAPSITDSEAGLRALFAFDPCALLVADAGGVLVGSLIAAWDGWRASFYRLAVDPGRRREGIATTLLHEGERRLRARGAIRLTAIVTGSDAAATGFWQAAGYARQPGQARFVRHAEH